MDRDFPWTKSRIEKCSVGSFLFPSAWGNRFTRINILALGIIAGDGAAMLVSTELAGTGLAIPQPRCGPPWRCRGLCRSRPESARRTLVALPFVRMEGFWRAADPGSDRAMRCDLDRGKLLSLFPAVSRQR